MFYKLSIAIIFGTIHNISFVSSAFVIFLGQNIQDYFWIGALLGVRRFIRIFIDIPCGILADKYGSKISFVLSMFFLFLAAFLLISTKASINLIIVIILLKGFADSLVCGKIEGHLYIVLQSYNCTNSYQKLLSIYYLCIDAASAIAMFIISYYLGSNLANIFTYCMLISFAGAIIALFVPNSYIQSSKVNMSDFMKQIKNLYSNQVLFMIILIWGMCSFLGWQLHSITAILMQSMGFESGKIIFVKGIEHTALSLGCIISILFSSKATKFKLSYIIIFISLVMLICAIFGYKNYILASICLYLTFFCLLEVSFEKIVNDIAFIKTRFLTNSVLTTVTGIYNLVGTLFFGYLIKFYGWKIGWMLFCIFIFLYLFLITYRLNKVLTITKNTIKKDMCYNL